jgi:hypothetical protein
LAGSIEHPIAAWNLLDRPRAGSDEPTVVELADETTYRIELWSGGNSNSRLLNVTRSACVRSGEVMRVRQCRRRAGVTTLLHF